jgi:hypothetical protein
VNKIGVKQVIRELRAIAREHGYEVRYYTYLGSKSDLHYFTPQFPLGEFDRRNKRILVRKYRNTFKHAVMCVLAHEIAHLLHVVNGQYPRYYSDYWILKIMEFQRNNKVDELDIHCFLQGIRAERNCDEWAQKFLAERGHKYSAKMAREYPRSLVMGYDPYRWWMERNK